MATLDDVHYLNSFLIKLIKTKRQLLIFLII